MSSGSDAEREIAIALAVRQALTAILERRAPITDAVNTAVCSILAAESRDGNAMSAAETPSERCRRENALAMQIMDAATVRGRDRDGPSMAAAQIATDPNDPAEMERLAQRFRRVRRQRNEQVANGHLDDSSSEPANISEQYSFEIDNA